MVKGCTKTCKSLHEAGGKKAKKECAKIREDGYAVEAGENDTLIIQKLHQIQMLLVFLDIVIL